MNLRTLLSLAALSGLASAHGLTTVYFGDASGNALASLTAPAVGSTFDVSVWYASDVALLDGELLLSYDVTAGTAGPGAVPTRGDLGAPTVVSSAAVLGPTQSAGAGLGDSAAPRPYGLSVVGITGAGGAALPATATARLFDVRFTNLGLTEGESAALSFYTSPTALLYRTSFLDGAVNEILPTVGSLTVQAVPEPASMLLLGAGALGLLRGRRKP